MRALPTTHTGWLAGDARRKTTPVPGVRALCARARRSRAVFRLPVGAARHAKAAVPPRAHFRYGSGDLPAEALRPRRGGGRDAVHPSVHPWQGAADFGRRPTGGGAGVAGIWPQAILVENPARRAGSAKRTQAGAAGRSARERPSRVARSGRSPGRPPKPLVPFFGSFLGQARKELAVGRLPTSSAAP